MDNISSVILLLRGVLKDYLVLKWGGNVLYEYVVNACILQYMYILAEPFVKIT